MLEVTLTQPAFFATSQLQSFVESLTLILPLPPAAEKDWLLGESKIVQAGAGSNERFPTHPPHVVDVLMYSPTGQTLLSTGSKALPKKSAYRTCPVPGSISVNVASPAFSTEPRRSAPGASFARRPV